MNTSTLINNKMTLEEKLAAIDVAVVQAQLSTNSEVSAHSGALATLNSVDLVTCEGCQ